MTRHSHPARRLEPLLTRHKAIDRASQGFALLVRPAIPEGGARWRRLFYVRKSTAILQFLEGVQMHYAPRSG
jgi:hypothetical protein